MVKHSCANELRNAQLKATPTRLAILKMLETKTTPVDVATIMENLESSGLRVDPATVFRIINLFTQKGLTSKLSLNEGKFRYEIASKGDHHHLICQSCGKMEDVADPWISSLEKTIEKKKGFKIKSHSLEFFGICLKCQS